MIEDGEFVGVEVESVQFACLKLAEEILDVVDGMIFFELLKKSSVDEF